LRADIHKQRALTNAQQLRLESQQEQITQLLSQVRMIRASLKVKAQTGSAVRLAKVVVPSRTTPESTPARSGGN
jgi:hypothetical protein